MKILLGSDLHLEHWRDQNKFIEKYPLPDESEYDVVVLAGDIWTGMNGVEWSRRVVPNNKHIVYIPGNHCYYGKDYTVLSEAFRNYKYENVHILMGDSIKLDDVTFIGATLWSKAELSGYPDVRDLINRSISDFKVIRHGPIEMFSVGRMQLINDKESNYLRETVNSTEGKKVLLTHFMPTKDCINGKYKGDALNPYFCNEIDDIVAGVDLVLYGHTHERQDIIHASGVRMVCNPHGYPGENPDPWNWIILNV